MEEFAIITGLNCGKVPDFERKKLPAIGIKDKLIKDEKTANRVGLMYTFKNFTTNSNEELIKAAKLYCLENLILAKQPGTTLDEDYIKMGVMKNTLTRIHDEGCPMSYL